MTNQQNNNNKKSQSVTIIKNLGRRAR